MSKEQEKQKIQRAYATLETLGGSLHRQGESASNYVPLRHDQIALFRELIQAYDLMLDDNDTLKAIRVLEGQVRKIAKDIGKMKDDSDFARKHFESEMDMAGYPIETMVKEAHENAKEKGWWDKVPEVGTSFMLMSTELGEAMEEHRKGMSPTAIYRETDLGNRHPYPPLSSPDPTALLRKPEGIPIELADVVIRIADFCGYHKIDLAYAIKLKMKYNKTRSHKHGGKVV